MLVPSQQNYCACVHPQNWKSVRFSGYARSFSTNQPFSSRVRSTYYRTTVRKIEDQSRNASTMDNGLFLLCESVRLSLPIKMLWCACTSCHQSKDCSNLPRTKKESLLMTNGERRDHTKDKCSTWESQPNLPIRFVTSDSCILLLSNDLLMNHLLQSFDNFEGEPRSQQN
jgi:hypothetical protein